MRAGLLGTGYWATHTHAPGLATQVGIEFVGVWGRNLAKTGALAASYGVRAYDDVDKLLNDVDLVSIALSPDAQAELAVKAAGRGRHLLLEKPVALDLDAARRVADVAARNNVSTLVFLSYRFDPRVNAFVQHAMEVDGWHGGRLIHCSSIDNSVNPYANSPWRRDKGGLWDIGPHALSIVLPVLGPVEQVTAVVAPFQTYIVVLRHRSAAVSTLVLSINAPEAAAEWSATFVGQSGVLSLLRDGKRPASQAYAFALQRLLANMRDGVTRDAFDALAAVDVIAILVAAEQSASLQRTVSL